MWSVWKVLVDVVSKSCQEVFKVAKHLENKVEPVTELGFHSSSIDHCERNVLSESRVHSSNPESKVSVSICFTTMSDKKLMVEPTATVGLVSIQQPFMVSPTIPSSLRRN